jgi:hypothetical protein
MATTELIYPHSSEQAIHQRSLCVLSPSHRLEHSPPNRPFASYCAHLNRPSPFRQTVDA